MGNEAAAPAAWRLVNRTQLAKLMGVHQDSVTRLAREGMPIVRRGGAGKEGRYDAVACLAWWRDHLGRNTREAAQARALNASGALNELKLAEKRAELWSTADIVLAGQAVVRCWLAGLRALPRRLIASGAITREQGARVAGSYADLQREIAAWRPL